MLTPETTVVSLEWQLLKQKKTKVASLRDKIVRNNFERMKCGPKGGRQNA
jgi:hypothetical protein